MEVINWLLINAGNAAQWLWAALQTLFGIIGDALNFVLNPVLSPVLRYLNPVWTTIGDGVYAILSPLPIWLGLTVISALCGVLMLIAFRYTSNQAAIGRSRDAISANLLALKLFKDDMGVAFGCQRCLLGALLRWQWHMLRPLVILVILLLPVFAQMGTRYQWRPLHPGEQTYVKLHLRDRAEIATATLQPCAGLAEAVGPVPGGDELVWRVRGGEPGRYALRFELGAEVVEKELVVGRDFQRVSAERPGRQWTSQLIHPAERPVPADSPIQSIEIQYPGIDSYICGADWWILYFFVISMVAALLLLPFYKVRF